MASAIGLTIVKQFTYRGDPTEEWSNTYWLTGTPPGPSTEWKTLFDQLVALEKKCYAPTSKVARGVGYNDDSEGAHAVWTVDLEALGGMVPGTLTSASTVKYSGDQAGVIEWRTERKNSRGKWVYLRKYFHDGFLSPVESDNLAGETANAYGTFGVEMFDGIVGGAHRIRSQKQVEDLGESRHIPYVTTRTLKRRGKRP